jgi:hypothetical protein
MYIIFIKACSFLKPLKLKAGKRFVITKGSVYNGELSTSWQLHRGPWLRYLQEEVQIRHYLSTEGTLLDF